MALEFMYAAGAVSHKGIKNEGCKKNMRVNSYCIWILMYMDTSILLNLVS